MGEGRMKTMNLTGAGSILRRERRNNSDRYVPLSRLRPRAGKDLGASHERYRINIEGDGPTLDLGLTEQSLHQLTGLASVPAGFMEKIPVSVGLATLRSCLTLAVETREDPLMLVRLGAGGTVARALLPSSFVRYDDLDLFEDINLALSDHEIRVTNFSAQDDLFHIRLVMKDSLELGTDRHSDPAWPGLDIRSSETGHCPLEMRRVLVRMVCLNGMTAATTDQESISRRKTGRDRGEIQAFVRTGLRESIAWGSTSTERLRKDRERFVADPSEEIERVFHTYRLGSTRSTAGRLLRNELGRHSNLFGVSRFQFIQAFTQTAQALEPRQRSLWEDGMGAYLFEE